MPVSFVSLSNLLVASAVTAAVPPPPGSIEIAYRAVKTVAFAVDVDVEGRSNQIDLCLQPAGDERWVIRATVFVQTFHSGHRGRDQSVAELLGPEISFNSDVVDRRILERLRTGVASRLSGSLQLGGRTHPVALLISADTERLQGTLTLKLSAYGVRPPRLGPFAVGGRVHDQIEIQVRGPWPSLDSTPQCRTEAVR